MAVTIQDVARLAGVNSSTVSRVINGKATITDETKAKVYAAMQELDYHPNSLARSLASGSSGAIGVIVDARDAEAFANEFFSRSLFAIEKEAQARGYHVIIANGAQSRGETIENLMKEHKVDGLILPPTTVRPALMKTIGQFPYVVLGTPDTMRSEACWVDNNNEQGAELAVKHLLERGYLKIAYLGGREKRGFTKRRVRGYEKNAGGQRMVLPTDGTAEEACTVAREILSAADHPDGFVCNDNLAAFGLLKACRSCGLRIPDDIGIVAFDNYPLAEYTDPPLTIVDIDTAMLGEQTAQLLFRRIKDSRIGNQQIMLSATLVARASTERVANV
ncbi:MAG: LacI family DNA-binding transcriptional regulator [Clostridia bacterium]|nr:LacI family DNA-binding transcriptional regulator [Clostridia bacterium]